MTVEFNLDAYKADLDETVKKGREAFKGRYKEQLNELCGLSVAEIDKITPDMTDLEKYDELITVVKEASRVNLSQAQLKAQIEELGSIAIKIAKRVPSLATLFL